MGDLLTMSRKLIEGYLLLYLHTDTERSGLAPGDGITAPLHTAAAGFCICADLCRCATKRSFIDIDRGLPS